MNTKMFIKVNIVSVEVYRKSSVEISNEDHKKNFGNMSIIYSKDQLYAILFLSKQIIAAEKLGFFQKCKCTIRHIIMYSVLNLKLISKPILPLCLLKIFRLICNFNSTDKFSNVQSIFIYRINELL